MDERAVLIGTRDGIFGLDSAAPLVLQGRAVNHLLANGADIWAIADGTSILLNPDMATAPSIGELTTEHANCLVVADDRLFIGASAAVLYELADGELHRAKYFDDAPSRSSWYTPWGGPPDIRSMACDLDGTIYVNVHVGGVVRSTDRGRTWSDTMDIDNDAHEVAADTHTLGRAYAASAVGLGVTEDAGASWNFISEGLHAPYCRAVATSDSTVFVSASLGSGGRQAALYRMPRQGGPLERCQVGLPEWFTNNLDTFCLAARGSFVVAGDAAGTVYVSHDDGESWETAIQGLPGLLCLGIR